MFSKQPEVLLTWVIKGVHVSSAIGNTFITFEECCIINLHWAPWGLFPSTVRYNIELGDRLSIDYLNSYNRAAWEIFIFAQPSIEVLSVTIRVPGTHSFVTKPRPGNLSAQLRLKDCHTSFQKGICHSFRSLGLSPLIYRYIVIESWETGRSLSIPTLMN